MQKCILSLLFSSLLLSSTKATRGGIALALDSYVMKEFTTPISPIFVNVLNKLTMPEIDVDYFEITDVKLDINPIDPDFI